MAPLTIGQLARRAGVGVETVRYYERRGLMPEPPRKESGYRQFLPEDLSRLRFIRRAQQLGFSLREIKELLALRLTPGCNCERVLERTNAKIADVEARIRSLRRMLRVLKKLAEACRRRESTSGCPILEALDSREAIA
jgi:MerR family mercuric resistance operon transcriptional regulator